MNTLCTRVGCEKGKKVGEQLLYNSNAKNCLCKARTSDLFIVTLPLTSNSHLFETFISCALSVTPLVIDIITNSP